MTKKKYAHRTIAPECGFGGDESNEDLSTLPANSNFTCKVEFVEFVKVKKSSQLSYGTFEIERVPVDA